MLQGVLANGDMLSLDVPAANGHASPAPTPASSSAVDPMAELMGLDGLAGPAPSPPSSGYSVAPQEQRNGPYSAPHGEVVVGVVLFVGYLACEHGNGGSYAWAAFIGNMSIDLVLLAPHCLRYRAIDHGAST